MPFEPAEANEITYLRVAARLGATHVLAKPFSMNELLSTVQAALEPGIDPQRD